MTDDSEEGEASPGVDFAARSWTKVDRLIIVAAIAPRLRSFPHRDRIVQLINRDNEVVGTATLGEVQDSLLLRKRIEIDVFPEVRPREIMCECGHVMLVPAKGTFRRKCDACRNYIERVPCAGDCGKLVVKDLVYRKTDEPRRCSSCYYDWLRTQPKVEPVTVECAGGCGKRIREYIGGKTPPSERRCGDCYTTFQKSRHDRTGLCTRCPQAARPGFKMCARCATRAAKAQQQRAKTNNQKLGEE